MTAVVVEGEPNGLAEMIAGLVEANVAADAGKARLLESLRGAAQLDVRDADVTIGLKFVPGTLTVTSVAVPGADVRITADAATVMALSTVPLRYGLPDVATPEGRAVVGKLATGQLRVAGLPLGLPLLRAVTTLLNVA
ncbi:MAG: hypothetical protein M3O86_01545 [Actinomycetota bacterium]|nr:hypothetical protein [Actinomycetota bacterium]